MCIVAKPGRPLTKEDLHGEQETTEQIGIVGGRGKTLLPNIVSLLKSKDAAAAAIDGDDMPTEQVVGNDTSNALLASVGETRSLDEVAEASDELKKVTIPSNVPTLILFRTPRFHRLVLWFMKHRHRGTKASYDELVDDYATVIQSVGDDVDRHPFESVATFSEEEWDSPPSESSRLHWVASIYLNLVRRWTRSFAFGRSIALHSLPLHELNGMSEFDHMTNAPGENKGGDENAVCRLARNGAIWKALREQSRCELVASWDNATGKSAISSHQLRREKSPHEGRYYYDVYDVQDYNNDDDDDDDDDDSSSDSSDEDPTPGTPRTSRTGKKRGGAGAARTPGTNRRERKKSQKS